MKAVAWIPSWAWIVLTLLLVVFNGLTWYAHRQDYRAIALDPALPSQSQGVLSVVHVGDSPPANWEKVLLGEQEALKRAINLPLWQKLILCTRWPLPALEEQDKGVAPWAEWLTSPSMAATLYSWDQRLRTSIPANIRDPISFKEWIRMTLHQVPLNPTAPPAEYQWRYPLPLWYALAAIQSQANATPLATPSVLQLYFADAATADLAESTLLRWKADGANAPGLKKLGLESPMKLPTRHWFWSEHFSFYADALENFPFWRNRQSCLHDNFGNPTP